MTKAEQLARELMSLCERYSSRDFERADELLRSGELFVTPLAALKAARDRLATGAQLGLSPQPAEKSVDQNGKSLPEKRKERPEQVDLDAFFSTADTKTREELWQFATRYLRRDILAHGSSIRAFAQILGLQLPNTLPSRAVLLRTFIECLSGEPSELRTLHLSQAESIKPEQSSLKQWSDLIVKRDDQQQGGQ